MFGCFHRPSPYRETKPPFVSLFLEKLPKKGVFELWLHPERPILLSSRAPGVLSPTFAGTTRTPRSSPSESTATNRFRPLTSLPPSKPRSPLFRPWRSGSPRPPGPAPPPGPSLCAPASAGRRSPPRACHPAASGGSSRSRCPRAGTRAAGTATGNPPPARAYRRSTPRAGPPFAPGPEGPWGGLGAAPGPPLRVRHVRGTQFASHRSLDRPERKRPR
ncbi:hypothetical protein BH11ARM2_BH11ARM2_22590 [soil metagenome]